jgi:hypothetical protein
MDDSVAEQQRVARVRALQIATSLLSQWIEQGVSAGPLAEAFAIVGSSALSALDGPDEAGRRMRRIIDGFERGSSASPKAQSLKPGGQGVSREL